MNRGVRGIVLGCAAGLVLAASTWSTAAAAIKVGAIFAVTGPASCLGGPEARSAEMAVARINREGGINGEQIELIVKDSAGSPEKAVSFAKQLIEEERVVAIIGPSTSGESMAVKKIAEDGRTVLISCAAAEVIVDPVSLRRRTPWKKLPAAALLEPTVPSARSLLPLLP